MKRDSTNRRIAHVVPRGLPLTEVLPVWEQLRALYEEEGRSPAEAASLADKLMAEVMLREVKGSVT